MSLMLASVTGPEEADIAVRQGADIVDLKDVAAGFGTVTPEVVRATVAAVGRRRPVSAVVGEQDVERIAATAGALAEAGASYIKIGLAPDRRRDDLIRMLAPLSQTAELTLVIVVSDRAGTSLIPVLAPDYLTSVLSDVDREYT